MFGHCYDYHYYYYYYYNDPHHHHYCYNYYYPYFYVLLNHCAKHVGVCFLFKHIGIFLAGHGRKFFGPFV